MKKNISINLQGIIFHIEEDGYEQLSRYLASIRTYFSNYEGHEEIVADIESRIAEIFSMRLSPGKQVITLEDVQALIVQMGNVTDFEVLEPMDEEIPYISAAGAGAGYQSGTYTHNGPRKLYRDVIHKVIGGVCAGIANYLNIDTLWVRLFFILLVVLGIVSAGFSTATGIIVYVILWIAMPQSDQLPETTVKKLYRDPEDKKLGGVASGIAKYFGTDVAVIRILFLVLLFAGGFGLIAYIILWIAVPEAVTLTERMQMKGSPVTLAGIERTLKDNLNMKDQNGEESALAKVILLPVRLISQVFSWLSKALGPILAVLITIIRIGAGIFLLFLSVGLTVGLITAFLASLGWLGTDPSMITLGDYPPSIMLEGFPRFGLVAGFLVGLIPLMLLIYLSVGLLIKRFIMTPMVGWSLFALWLVSLVVMIMTIVIYSGNFKRSGEVITSKSIAVDNYQTLVLDNYDTNLDYDKVFIDVREHNGSNVEIIQRVNAKGRTEEDAKLNAQMITYNVIQKNSVLRFDNTYEFKKGAAFRDQELDVILMLPKDKKLRLTRRFVYMMPRATFAQSYSTDKIVRNTWQVKGDVLECITCASDTLDIDRSAATGSNSDGFDFKADTFGNEESVLNDISEYGGESKSYDFRNFERVSISGPYHVQIIQGNAYSVRVRGDRKELKRMEVDQSGNEVEIRHEERAINLFRDHKLVLIQITAPDLKNISLGGAIKADISSGNSKNLNIDLAGATKAAINVRARNLKVDLAGASSTKLVGSADRFELDAAGASIIKADQLRARDVVVEASGMTKADVYASSSLRVDASGACNITYKGNPTSTDFDTSGASKVERK